MNKKLITAMAAAVAIVSSTLLATSCGSSPSSPSSPSSGSSPGTASAGAGQQLCDKFHADNPTTVGTIVGWTAGEVSTGKSWAQIKQELRAAMAVCPDITSVVQQSNELSNSD